MSRGLSGTMTSAAAATVVRPGLLAYFDFSGGAVRVHSGLGPLSWGGNTYTGLGDLGSVSTVKETTETRANGMQFTLSGIPSTMVTRILAEDYRGRSCKLWLAFFSSADAILSDPLLLFSGRMDQCLLRDDGGTSVCTITAESRLVELQRSRERRRTDEDQKSLFSGDRGFEYVAGLQDRQIHWGGNSSTQSK